MTMRKYLFALLAICLSAYPVYAVTCTATNSGNWTGSAATNTVTWTGTGCDGEAHPVAADYLRINGDVAVTIPAGCSVTVYEIEIGYTANSTGVSTLVNNGTLTMGAGNIYIGLGDTKDGQLTLGPDSVTAISTSTSNGIKFNNGWFNSTSYAGHFAKITGSGKIAGGTITTARQNVGLSYVSFQITGTKTFLLKNTIGAATPGFSVDHITSQLGDGWVVGSSDTDGTTPISITNSDFRDLTPNRNITISKAAGGTAPVFRHNTVTQSTSYTSLIPTTSTVTIDECVLANVTLAPSGTPYTLSNSVLTEGTAAAAQPIRILDSVAASTITNNYIMQTNDNMHPIYSTGSGGSGTHAITYNILEGIGEIGGTYTDNPDLFIPGPTPLSLNYSYNMVIGAGEQWCGVQNPDGAITVNVNHNNIVGTYNMGRSGGMFVIEYATPVVASGTINVLSNLHYGNAGSGEYSVFGTQTSGTQLVNADYNNHYNMGEAAYSPTRLTITGKTHDQAVNPKFADLGIGHNIVPTSSSQDYLYGTRNMARWDMKFGSSTGTAAAAMTHLLSINGYRGSPYYDQGGTASAYGPAHLVEWVRYGYSPTHGALRNAGSDGKTIGAVEWQNPRRKH